MLIFNVKSQVAFKGRQRLISKGIVRRGVGFTLVELLAILAIVGILIAFMFPVLGKARDAARSMQCMANLRNIGQAFTAYAAQHEGMLPVAYLFNCRNYYPAPGITHWSAVLKQSEALPESVFHCPAFERGGLSPTDTTADNLEGGQSNNASVVDVQVPRCAYTVNEAVCPQPFAQTDPPPRTPMGMCHYVGTTNCDLHQNRLYHYVRLKDITSAAATILATEWPTDWRTVSGPCYISAGLTVSLSYRPVHGFAPVTPNGLDPFDVSLLSPAWADTPELRRLTVSDVAATPVSPGWGQPRLNWIGRNHGGGRLTSFLYVDGHAESKPIEQTVAPFEWGAKFFSLQPGGDIVSP